MRCCCWYFRSWFFLSILSLYSLYSGWKILNVSRMEHASVVSRVSVLLSIVGGLAYVLTATWDAGVIRPNEENSVENGSALESQNYSYCAICQLYRPPGANHCHRCGVCFEG